MKIGVLKEIKIREYRVGLVPENVAELCKHGHEVFVESDAGIGIGFTDQDYIASGAKVLKDAPAIFHNAELIIKVKEPQPEECKLLTEKHTLFTFLHLAADLQQAQLLMQSGATAIAYETVTDANNRLPILAPMSEVAGRLAVQEGASCLEKVNGGKGILLGGVPGVAPANVVVLGGGVVGRESIKIALGMGAKVIVLDNNINQLRALEAQFGSILETQYSTRSALEKYIAFADLLIGAVLVPGAKAPKLVDESIIKTMVPGSVIVDVAIDQGGCITTSKPTNYLDPTYSVHDIVHYCVTNLPGNVPKTSTYALNNATLPFILQLANNGVKSACLANKHLLFGVNVTMGSIVCKAVSDALDLPYKSIDEVWQ